MIDKSVCIPGNIFVVNNKSVGSQYNCKENGLHAYVTGRPGWAEISVGTKIQIFSKVTSSNVKFKTEGSDKIYVSYWSDLKFKVDVIEGQEIKLPEKETVRYKIFKNGKPFKTKYYSDLGKIKSSLLIDMGYYNNQYEMFEKYKDRNPELQDNQVPEWFSYGGDFKRSDCKDIEIMSFTGKSKVPVKVEFDILKFYDQSMKLIDVTAQFGSAARKLFKENMETGEYSYLLVYSPDEYRDQKYVSKYGYNTFDFSVLKESQKIKDVMKASGVKGTKKCTRFGKTAIVFKTLDDLKSVMLRLEPKEYYILDCDGEQLVEKNTRFIKLIMLEEFAKSQEAVLGLLR